MNATATLVHSTGTCTCGMTPHWDHCPAYRPQEFDEVADPHCYVCGRHTDHFAEHDDLVAAGMARYDESDVVWTEAAEGLRILAAEVEGVFAYALRWEV